MTFQRRPASERQPPAAHRAALATYGLLIRLYPSDFQRRFSSDLLDCFDDLLTSSRKRGRTQFCSAIARTFIESPLSIATAWRHRNSRTLEHRANRPEATTRTDVMDRILLDLKVVLRGLLRNPLYFTLTIASLSVGVGATTTVLSAVSSILEPPGALPDPQQLSRVTERHDYGTREVSYGNFTSLREQTGEVFQDLALHRLETFALQTDDGATLTSGELVSANYFETLQLRPELGTFFRSADSEQPSSPLHAVLSYEFWHRAFGADRDVIGRVIELNDRQVEVVGVTPSGFEGTKFGLGMDLWVPVRPWGRANGWPDEWVEGRTGSSWLVIGRRQPHVGLDQAQQQLDVTAARLANDFPDSNRSTRFSVFDNSMADATPHIGTSATLISNMALAAACLVLIVAAANVAALQLARVVAGRSDQNLRSALGASRLRVLRLPLLEAAIVAIVSASLGVVVAMLASRLFLGYLPAIPYRFAIDFAPDLGVVSTIFLLTLAAALTLGILTALAGTGARRSTSLLAPGGRTSGPGASVARGLSGLVVAMMSVAFVILVLAGLFRQSLTSVRNADPGFESANRTTATLDVALAGDSSLNPVDFYERLLERVDGEPGVRGTALVSALPLADRSEGRSVFASDRSYQDDDTGERIWAASISPSYFDVMGIDVLEGRAFDSRDDQQSAAIVINQTLASRLWPDRSGVVGQTVRFNRDPSAPTLEVVGVVGNGRYRMVSETPTGAVYRSFQQSPRQEADVVVAMDPGLDDSSAHAASALRRAVGAVDPRVPLFQLRSLDDHVWSSLWIFRLGADLAAALAGVALVLAVAGLYGIMSYRVGQRRQELGIRIALGAKTQEILRQILLQSLRLATLGTLIGGALALASSSATSSLLVGIGGRDPLTFALIAAALIVVTVLATLRPGLTAARTNPARTLRSD